MASIKLRAWPCSGFDEVSPSEAVLRGLRDQEYDYSDSDTTHQANRIDSTRDALARLVEELHSAGVIDGKAVARIAGISPDDVVDD